LIPDDRKPTLYRTRGTAWVVCACGWKSSVQRDQAAAQLAWSTHIRAVLLGHA